MSACWNIEAFNTCVIIVLSFTFVLLISDIQIILVTKICKIFYFGLYIFNHEVIVMSIILMHAGVMFQIKAEYQTYCRDILQMPEKYDQLIKSGNYVWL